MAYVWQISIITFSSISMLRGVVLNSNPKKQESKISAGANLSNVINSYIIPPLKNASLSIILNKIEYKVSTNDKGAFSIELNYSIKEKPDISIFYRNKKLLINQKYPVFYKGSPGKIDVISDIDDTIIVSHSAKTIKRISTLAMVSPHKRKIVNFTKDILNYINKNKARVFYVSKSESNLFHILSSFIVHNELPKGVLFLTPYLNFKQLLSGEKVKNFKYKNIRFIIENSEEEKYVLIGDDTQKDMEIYTQVAKDFPSKILRIYIRQTKSKISKRKQLYWENLNNTFPDAVYFNEKTDINMELENLKIILK